MSILVPGSGNPVCSATFDLDEHHKVVRLRVTEGENNSLKYPAMIHHADLMPLNKIDSAASCRCRWRVVQGLCPADQPRHPDLRDLQSSRTGDETRALMTGRERKQAARRCRSNSNRPTAAISPRSRVRAVQNFTLSIKYPGPLFKILYCIPAISDSREAPDTRFSPLTLSDRFCY